MDHSKISDAIELLPPLETAVVRRILKVAYDHWMSAANYIDPNPHRGRRGDKLGLSSPDDLLGYMRSLDRNEPIVALTELMSTPRALKHLVGDVERSWSRLKGEAELADIIVVNALRQTVEPVIDFFYRNIDVARTERDRFDVEPANAPDRIATAWKELLSTLENPRAVQSLVDLLGIRRVTAGHGATGDISPQDVSRYEPTDYFRRILAGDIAAAELRDQTVLTDIAEWRRRTNDNMIVRLMQADENEDRYARVWEHFAATQFSPDELPPIASQIHARLLRRQGRTVLFDKAPASISLWRLLNRGRRDRWNDWLVREIRVALPISLLFAADLYSWYGSVPHGIVTTERRAQIRARLIDAARATYREPAALIRALSEDQPQALSRFITPPSEDEPPDSVTPVDLRWFAEIVTDAARIAPALIVPDVVVTFGRFGHRFERGDDAGLGLVDTYSLDRDRFAEFFGARTDDMLDAIAEFQTDTSVVLTAQPQVREWQAQRHNANER
jgi:hypothetical protein